MYKPMFIPPADSRLLVNFTNAILPAAARALAKIHDVRFSPDDFAHAEALRPTRALLSANHPTGDDPFVFFWLSRMLKQRFNYMAAREVFVGPKGWLLNRLGAYSVIRGAPDREALRTTRRLLAEEDRKVVIFPEGEIYGHNDRLLSFQSGVPQLGFWSLDDLQKAGRKPELPLLPIAIKYRCCESARPIIECSLAGLERAVKLETNAATGQYQRLLRVGDQVITRLEKDEGIKPDPGGDLKARVPKVRDAMMVRVARAIGVTVDQNQPVQERLHLLQHDLKSWIGLPSGDFTEYDEKLYRQRMQIGAPLFKEMLRIQNFLVITGDYIASNPTAERFLEVLVRVESEVFGEVRTRWPREALVRIAPPIRLEERYDAYRQSKRTVVNDITQEMENTIRTMLQELSSHSTPISLEA